MKVNWITGIVGALIGVVIGVAAWVGIYQLGYIAGIAGFIMLICSIKGFELLGGGLNIPAIIVCIILDLGAVYFAHNIAIAVSIMQELDGYSFTSAYKYIPYLLEYSEFAEAYYKDLVMGYGLTLVAIIPSIINYIKGNRKKVEDGNDLFS